MGYVGLALSELGAGKPAEAAATWQKLHELDPAAVSAAAVGLADLALYEGRTVDAKSILESGVAADLAMKNSDGAGRKLAMLAEVLLLTGRPAAAIASAERALATSTDGAVSVSAALVLARAGERKKALAVAGAQEKELEADPQMYGKVIRAAVELQAKRYREAIGLLKEAQKNANSWPVHRELATAYLEAGSFAEADTEIEICLKRKGEATAVFLDEVPTYRLYPPLYYDLGRAREGLKSPGAAEAFRTYLGLAADPGDPRVSDARKRLGGG
jgi:tetratricopeptide (TPR) repeat protein